MIRVGGTACGGGAIFNIVGHTNIHVASVNRANNVEGGSSREELTETCNVRRGCPILLSAHEGLSYHGPVANIDDDALILDHHPYRDRHMILAVLTRSNGVQRGVLRRARGGKTPLAGAAQVLSHVRATLSYRPHAELADFRQLELVTSSFPLARDLATSAAGSVVAELLATFCPLAEPAEKSFRLGVAALDALLSGRPATLVVAYVQYWTLALGGVLAEPESIAADIGRRDADFLATCRRQSLADVAGPVPSGAARWLDRRVREEAERPQRALTFFRSMVE